MEIGQKKQIGIGTGAISSSNFGNLNYEETARAKLTNGKTGPSVFFADNIVQKVDLVCFKNTQVNTLNITVNFIYDIRRKIKVGFNIDAVGFSFAGNKKGTYFTNTGASLDVTAKPTAFNLLLISENDLASLNSAFYG